MKLSRQMRRERALSRFTIMSYQDWQRSKYGDDCIERFGSSDEPEDIADFTAYQERKEQELKALKRKG